MSGMLLAQAPQEVQRAFDQLVAEEVITQDVVALKFAEEAAGKLRHDADRNAWFAWDGVRWANAGKHCGFQFSRQLGRRAAAGGSKSELKEAGKAAFAAGVERFAQGDERIAVKSEIWDTDPFLLGTPAGVVDLKTGELRPARPEDNITKLTAVAPTVDDSCPRWLEFVRFVSKGDGALNRYLQQVCGYCLTGDIREHALWFFYGDGGNGKGTFVETIAWILADYAVAAAMETFTASRGERHSTELAMLRGARLVRASETEQGKAWAEARIKALTGGDTISAHFMHRDYFQFAPQFKLIVQGNHKPALRVVDEAIRRRFNIVPFTEKPPVQDLEFREKLRAEAPAILRWMIDGCLDWQKNGLLRPKSVADATENYLSDQDLIGQWLDEKCDCEPGNIYKSETVAALYASWCEYAKAANAVAGSKASFSDTLVSRRFEPHRTTKARMFRGIIFRRAEMTG